ncbi:MAG: hypothetical protein ACLQD8_03800 [Thermoplasmata archaeon]
MPNTCPDCGASVEFSAATARVLHGDCSGCGHAFTILEGMPPIPPGQPAAQPDEGAEGAAPDAPACGSCGASLTVRAASDTTLEAVCTACSSHFSYTLATAPLEREPPRKARRFEPVSEERGGFERPPSRPCRECGGALQFTTTAEGLVTGECAQCGNRFTLPPRREDGGRGGRPPFRRPGGGGFRPRYGSGGGGYSRGGGRGGPPRSEGGSRPYRRREAPRDDDDDDSDRRRRRPRRE